MGNLGRAGYGASVDGMWPYSYDTCDVGTLPNQTFVLLFLLPLPLD
jgi:beta-glucanase (GH16 family)